MLWRLFFTIWVARNRTVTNFEVKFQRQKFLLEKLWGMKKEQLEFQLKLALGFPNIVYEVWAILLQQQEFMKQIFGPGGPNN